MPTSRMPRRPNRSDSGPAISWPAASPIRQAVTVSCATDVAAPSSAVSAGKGGEIEVHRDRTEHRQQEQQRRQQPTERRAEAERSDRACHQPHGRADRRESLTRGVPTGHPSSGCRDLRCRHGQPSRGTRVPHVAAGEAHPGRRGDRRPVRTGAWPACDAPRSRPSRASASSTTPSSNAAPSPALPPPCSTRSRGRCSSTTPSALTCSTSPAPPTASPPPVVPVAAPSRPPRLAPACCGPCRRSPTGWRSCAISTRTCSPPMRWDARSTRL